VTAHALLAKLSVKQVCAQVGRPLRSCARTEVAAAARRARMVGNCMIAVVCLFLFELGLCVGSCLDGWGMRMGRGGSKERERKEVIYFSTSRCCIVVSISDRHMARLLLDAYSGETRHERRGYMPL